MLYIHARTEREDTLYGEETASKEVWVGREFTIDSLQYVIASNKQVFRKYLCIPRYVDFNKDLLKVKAKKT